MNTIWPIPELVRNILGTLLHKELVKVITVSRHCWGATVPLLWHAIHRSQLEELFPLGSDYSLGRVREDGDVSRDERRQYYAASVRKLNFVTQTNIPYMQALLKHSPLSNYLPNLTQIQLFMDPSLRSADPEAAIQCIAVPALQELIISSFDPKNSALILPKLTQALDAVHASLRSLELAGMVLEASSRLFGAQPGIQVLKIHAKASELGAAWQAAGTLLPELQFAKFTTNYSQSNIYPAAINKSSFPSLTEVELALPHVDALSDFLGCISSPNLRSSLQLQWWDRSPWDATTSLPRHLGLANLSFQGGGLSTCLGNDVITSISRAFPNLERLEIVETRMPPGPPLITIRDLQPLIDSCPKLRKLSITVDARCEGTLDPPTSTIREALEDLDFQRSWVEEKDVEATAGFLSTLWPNLKWARTAWGEKAQDGDEQKQRWASIWGWAGARSGERWDSRIE